MATDLQGEIEAFHRFLGERLERGIADFTIEASIDAFRAYQRDVEALRRELAPSLERAARGEGKEIDFDALRARMRQHLCAQGIPE